ncbi:Glycosyl transferases group 1 [Rhizobium sp. RU33A]|nr:Glycosyl transferases group 1 [Rhizobium sp. RU33A]
MQAADLLVVNSEQESARLRELGLTPPIAIIPNGVDLQGFSAELANKKRERTILFFSRIDPKKGIPDLLAAWQSLSDHKGYRLHICGHGEAAYVAGIQKQIESLGLANVVLLPPVFGPRRWDVFASASVYVLPSYSENFGITVAEALSAGLPVITTRATPWSSLPGEGVGWIIGNDVAELASALRAAMDVEPVALSRMRLKAMEYAGRRFGWDAIARQYIETYNWIAAPETAAPSWVISD